MRSSSSSPPAGTHDHGGDITLRPYSAIVLSIVVWVLAAGFGIDAVMRRFDVETLKSLSLLILMSAGTYAVLWAPRIIVRDDCVTMRNVFRVHEIPFAAIDAIRIVAMVRIEARGKDGRPRTYSAWNAPAVGKSKAPSRQEEREIRAGLRTHSQSARLHAQIRGCRSVVLLDRWNRWIDVQEEAVESAGADGRAASRAAGTEVKPATVSTGLNVPSLVVLFIAVQAVLSAFVF